MLRYVKIVALCLVLIATATPVLAQQEDDVLESTYEVINHENLDRLATQ